ncbi:MAG: phosphoribosyl-AMP cyclohydrolase [Leptospiraceae bacterium]|nr:phosphoribosyl-AMP cyclohydrolase [Leptospiraceae bacterium]
MRTIIFQDKQSKEITSIEVSEKIPDNFQDVFIDCDEDSVLVQGNFTPTEKAQIASINQLHKFDGLVPVVTQDQNKNLLMQAFLNFEALQLTLDTNFAHYFSRSRNKLWKKGEESGHLQKIILVEYSKKYNFYLYSVKQTSVACHTGNYSCFFRKLTKDSTWEQI